MTHYKWDELELRDRVYVVKAIAAATGAIGRHNDLDITLTINGVDVDFLAFSRSMIDGMSADLNARASELVRDKLDKLEMIIRELAAGL